MHVLILCEYGTVNGGERSLLAALAHCPPNVRMTVLAPSEGRLATALSASSVTHEPFSLLDSSGKRLSPERLLDDLAAITERLAPDVVHANSLSMGRITGRLAARVSCPCTGHLRDIMRLSRTAAGHLNGNDRLVAVSAATRDFHIAQGLDAARVAVLHNGIDCEAWRPRPKPGELHAELQLPEDTMIAVTVGQIGLRKGLDRLVQAAIQLAGQFPQLHYAVIGERYSTKQESIAFEQSLHDSLENAGIADRFHWLGYREDVGRLLGDVDLLIHPARQEPFGRVLLEASACSVPIVATRVGGTAEMLTDGESALLVPPDDARALANAVRQLVCDAHLRTRLGDSARRHMSQRFNIIDRASDLFALWTDIAH